jgi:hypothetical protein
LEYSFCSKNKRGALGVAEEPRAVEGLPLEWIAFRSLFDDSAFNQPDLLYYKGALAERGRRIPRSRLTAPGGCRAGLSPD